jgi:hypothetical protein
VTTSASSKAAGLKQKLAYEFQRFLMVFVYLALLIGAFTTYRRLLMDEYHLGYLAYGYGLIQALVLAKLIVLGESLGLGERFCDRPLIIPTLYKAVIFGILALVFSLLEHFIRGLLHGKDLAVSFQELVSVGGYEILARVLVMFVAFIPFFAFREAGRVLGQVKLFELFFRSKASPAN